MTHEEYVLSRRPSLLDEAVETEAVQRCSTELLHTIIDLKINCNRLIFARMAYLQGVFTEFPQGCPNCEHPYHETKQCNFPEGFGQYCDCTTVQEA